MSRAERMSTQNHMWHYSVPSGRCPLGIVLYCTVEYEYSTKFTRESENQRNQRTKGRVSKYLAYSGTPFVDFSSPNFRNLVRTTLEEGTPGRVFSFHFFWKVTVVPVAAKSGRSGRAVSFALITVWWRGWAVVEVGVWAWACGCPCPDLSSWIPDRNYPMQHNMHNALSMHYMHCAFVRTIQDIRN